MTLLVKYNIYNLRLLAVPPGIIDETAAVEPAETAKGGYPEIAICILGYMLGLRLNEALFNAVVHKIQLLAPYPRTRDKEQDKELQNAKIGIEKDNLAHIPGTVTITNCDGLI
jgi:hypothetical protein